VNLQPFNSCSKHVARAEFILKWNNLFEDWKQGASPHFENWPRRGRFTKKESMTISVKSRKKLQWSHASLRCRISILSSLKSWAPQYDRWPYYLIVLNVLFHLLSTLILCLGWRHYQTTKFRGLLNNDEMLLERQKAYVRLL